MRLTNLVHTFLGTSPVSIYTLSKFRKNLLTNLPSKDLVDFVKMLNSGKKTALHNRTSFMG